jgi:hypothetical protein
LLDIAAQKQRLLSRVPKALFSSCKDFRCLDEEHCYQFLVEPRQCFQLGYINGFYMSTPWGQSVPSGLGGNTHDGDEDPAICPMAGLPADQTMGAQTVIAERNVQRPIDLRATLNPSELTVESVWCRWYGGPITVEADTAPPQPKTIHHPSQVLFDTFRPERGQRVSMVGDWMTDIGPATVSGAGGSWSELHEVRFGATVKSDRRIINGQTMDLMDFLWVTEAAARA